MAIARRIAERHGGSVWAHTGRRDGCTIVVLLPEAVVTGVLVCDDAPDMRALLRDALDADPAL